jgi:hypothetical protein
MGQQHQLHEWRLYGWFCGLMFCGSCFGAVTWAARLMALVSLFKRDSRSEDNNDNAQKSVLFALFSIWRAVFSVTYAVEFMCLSTAKLMVLDRLSKFIAPQKNALRNHWSLWSRVVVAVVVLGNAVGLAANVSAAVHYQKSADAARAASADFVANNSKAGDEHGLSSQAEAAKALSIASVQAFCEVAVLLLIITAFSVAGIACIRRFSSALSVLGADGPEMAATMKTSRSTVNAAVALGRQMRKEIVVTTSFVFVAFLLRSVVSTMLAVAFQLQEGAKTCYGERSLCDASCVNVYTHIMYWNTYAMSLFL